MKPKLIILLLLLAPLYVVINGCTRSPPFSDRIAPSELSAASIIDNNIERLNIIWEPKNFPEKFQLKGPKGISNWGDRYSRRDVKIPTGIAISERLQEALGQTLIIDKTSSKVLTIEIYAQSNFKFTPGDSFMSALFSGRSLPCHLFNYGEVDVNAYFKYQDLTWAELFHNVELISGYDCSTTTGPLEKVWDKVAIQMAQSIILFINQIENNEISNLDQLRQTGPGIVNCISGGIRQYVEPSQCDRLMTVLDSIPDTVNCFSSGKRQWVERSQCD